MERRLRHATIASMILAATVGLFAASQAIQLGSLNDHRRRVEETSSQFSAFNDPELNSAMRHAELAALAALEGMKAPRALVLGALAIFGALAFAAAGRLLRAGELPRNGLRRILAGSLLGAAFLRTADGAMWAVVAQRSGRAAAPLLARTAPDAQVAEVAQVMPGVLVAGVILHTALIAGAFLLLGQYFRSQKVKDVVALYDRQHGHDG